MIAPVPYHGPVTRRPVRILQTSDVHLGPRTFEPNGRLHRDECICPIDVVAHLVDEHAVDVVLIVGDLFEHARVSSNLVRETFDRLAGLGVEVALLPGNHDVYDHDTVYRRDREHVEASGVHFFDDPAGRAVDLAGGALRIWARAMEEHAPHYLPLADVPPHPGDRWFVAAAHGHFVETHTHDAHRSSRITPADIHASGADYVALGHWHVTTDLSERGVTTPAWYCGAPLFGYGAGRMLLVDLEPGVGPVVRSVDVLDHAASTCEPPVVARSGGFGTLRGPL
jgi:exonuclease SbcD